MTQVTYVAEFHYSSHCLLVGPYDSCSEAAGAYDEAVVRHCGRAAANLTNFAAHMMDGTDMRYAVAGIGGSKLMSAAQFVPFMYNPSHPLTGRRSTMPMPGELTRMQNPKLYMQQQAQQQQALMLMKKPTSKFYGVQKMRGGYRSQFIHNRQLYTYVPLAVVRCGAMLSCTSASMR